MTKVCPRFNASWMSIVPRNLKYAAPAGQVSAQCTVFWHDPPDVARVPRVPSRHPAVNRRAELARVYPAASAAGNGRHGHHGAMVWQTTVCAHRRVTIASGQRFAPDQRSEPALNGGNTSNADDHFATPRCQGDRPARCDRAGSGAAARCRPRHCGRGRPARVRDRRPDRLPLHAACRRAATHDRGSGARAELLPTTTPSRSFHGAPAPRCAAARCRRRMPSSSASLA